MFTRNFNFKWHNIFSNLFISLLFGWFLLVSLLSLLTLLSSTHTSFFIEWIRLFGTVFISVDLKVLHQGDEFAGSPLGRCLVEVCWCFDSTAYNLLPFSWVVLIQVDSYDSTFYVEWSAQKCPQIKSISGVAHWGFLSGISEFREREKKN